MRETGAGCSCWIVYSTNGDDNIGKKGGNKLRDGTKKFTFNYRDILTNTHEEKKKRKKEARFEQFSWKHLTGSWSKWTRQAETLSIEIPRRVYLKRIKFELDTSYY